MDTKQLDYQFIRLWLKTSGSMDYYINAEVEKARSMNAPQEAIYERDGKWHLIDEVDNTHTLASLIAECKSGKYSEKTRIILLCIYEKAMSHYRSFVTIRVEKTKLKKVLSELACYDVEDEDFAQHGRGQFNKEFVEKYGWLIDAVYGKIS